MVIPSLTTILEGITLLIIVLSIVLLLRQKGSYFRPIKATLILAYVLFLLRLALESEIIIFLGQSGVITFGYIYDLGINVGITAQLLAFEALAVCAVAIHNGRKEALSMKVFFRFFKIEGRWNKSLLIYTFYLHFLIILAWGLRPFTWVFNERSPGDIIISSVFQDWYIFGVFILLIAFLAYPCRLIIIRSRRIRSPDVSKSLLLLFISWSGIGVVLFVFNLFLRSLNLEIKDAGNLLAGAFFLITAYVYSRTTLLESFFEEPKSEEAPRSESSEFSKQLRDTHHKLRGRKMLLEVVDSSDYYQIIKKFVEETADQPKLAIVVTGHPSLLKLAISPEVKLLYLTPLVSYPKEGDLDKVILIPKRELYITLSLIDRAIKANPNVELSVVFDILSDPEVSSKIRNIHKFLTQSLDLLSKSNITALYILNPSTYDPKDISIIKALFTTQIVLERGELRIHKNL